MVERGTTRSTSTPLRRSRIDDEGDMDVTLLDLCVTEKGWRFEHMLKQYEHKNRSETTGICQRRRRRLVVIYQRAFLHFLIYRGFLLLRKSVRPLPPLSPDSQARFITINHQTKLLSIFRRPTKLVYKNYGLPKSHQEDIYGLTKCAKHRQHFILTREKWWLEKIRPCIPKTWK